VQILALRELQLVEVMKALPWGITAYVVYLPSKEVSQISLLFLYFLGNLHSSLSNSS
jgi:hypothetical protein